MRADELMVKILHFEETMKPISVRVLTRDENGVVVSAREAPVRHYFLEGRLVIEENELVEKK